MTENKISNKDKENKKHHFIFNSSDLMSDKDKTSPAYQLVKEIVFYVFLLLLVLIVAIYNKPSAFKFITNNTNEANQDIKVSKNYNTELDSAIEKIKDGYTLVYATDPQTGAECYVTKSGINYRLNEQGKPVINKKYVIAKTDSKSSKNDLTEDQIEKAMSPLLTKGQQKDFHAFLHGNGKGNEKYRSDFKSDKR